MSPGHFSASTWASSWGVSLSNGEPPLSPKPRRSKVSTLIPAVANCRPRSSQTFRCRLHWCSSKTPGPDLAAAK